MPWIISSSGYVSRIKISLNKAQLVAQDHAWPHLLRSQSLVLDFNLNYSRYWNAPQSWDINLDTKHAKLMFLFDHKNVLRDLINDWSRDSKPDVMSFVPFTYRFKINAQKFEFITLANDYNWIASTFENSYLSFFLKNLNLSIELPFTEFCPPSIPIKMDFKASTLICRISLSATSTSLYAMRELHSNLRFVNANGVPTKKNPFNITEEQMSDDGSFPKLVWIDCWRSTSANLVVYYVYHPQPWVDDFHRFMPGPQCRVSQDEILRQLRPGASKHSGPSMDELMKDKYSPSYMEPDTVDIHLTIPSSKILCHGMLLRLFIHVKENYFGVNQVPVLLKDGPKTETDHFTSSLLAQNKPSSTTEKPKVPTQDSWQVPSQIRRISQIVIQNTQPPDEAATQRRQQTESASNANKKIVDPRHYRPFAVRVSVSLHGIQAHLPLHSNVSSPVPCPTAFLDCITFEMDKKYRGTRMQVIVSPLLVAVYDMNQHLRPKSNAALSYGRLQIGGLQFRGHAMFSGDGLPLDSELLEYAWSMEITLGSLMGQLTSVQLASVTQVLTTFVQSVVDAENGVQNSISFELCQHGYPQTICPHWHVTESKSPLGQEGHMLCPTEAQLKYRMLRVFLDSIDLAIVESGACLELKLDPIRLATCNLHGQTSKNGLSLVLPRISVVQYLRSVEVEKVKSAEDDFMKTLIPSLNAQESPESELKPDIKKFGAWFEAGSIVLGPLHLNGGLAPHTASTYLHQSQFLRQHDQDTRRLWFIWSSINTSAPPLACGCYGGCEFFGQNLMGKVLHEEIRTGIYKPRAIFPPRHEYCSNTDPPGSTLLFNNIKFSDRSLQFGESLILDGQLVFESHAPAVCFVNQNGLNMMRLETWSLYEEAHAEKLALWTEKAEQMAENVTESLMLPRAPSILEKSDLDCCEMCMISEGCQPLEFDSMEEYYDSDSDLPSTRSSCSSNSQVRVFGDPTLRHSTESGLHLLQETDVTSSCVEGGSPSHKRRSFFGKKSSKPKSFRQNRSSHRHKQLEEDSDSDQVDTRCTGNHEKSKSTNSVLGHDLVPVSSICAIFFKALIINY
ncbi:hypothetical protein Ciccas_003119 [Cichlidogyrus casuarinus]|uniref:Bridge-like lipid transfer protein family member 1 N-terminal domain-containing protein n=1 Tax=Cichlidogyrus casuarinus TaxID=1844966 RepID=A0ABD2QFA9_9PLAT